MPDLDPVQQSVFDEVLRFCDRILGAGDDRRGVFVIRGAAGTGKSTLLSALLLEMSSRARSGRSGDPLLGRDVRLLVNHAEMWRSYRNLAGTSPQLRKLQVMRPTPYINASERQGSGADIVLVDEAHLLLTQPDPYTRFRAQNHLREIIRLSRVTVVVYDDAQVLRLRGNWSNQLLSEVLSDAEVAEAELTDQHRMGASREVRDWIDSFVGGTAPVTPPPPGDSHFELEVFTEANRMNDAVMARSRRGSARLISTYDYPYRLDGADYFIDEPGFHVRWDRYDPQSNQPWSERPDTLNEVGSVYTVQGLDLDWAGVILGPSNVLDPEGRLKVVPDLYEDQAAFTGIARLRANGLDDVGIERQRERLLRNALETLLTRPRRGLFLYAHDLRLREALRGARG